MKKTIFLIALAATTLIAASCSKSVQCKCTTIEGAPEVTYVNANNGFSCSKITKLGFERQVEGKYVRELKDVTCENYKESDF